MKEEAGKGIRGDGKADEHLVNFLVIEGKRLLAVVSYGGFWFYDRLNQIEIDELLRG